MTQRLRPQTRKRVHLRIESDSATAFFVLEFCFPSCLQAVRMRCYGPGLLFAHEIYASVVRFDRIPT